ncbi:hypothetical protein BH09MYX1_BH09MYX1_09410 [soil metagenome]
MLILSSPICVNRSPEDDWTEGYGDRMDAVDAITLYTTPTPSLAKGARVRVQGSHAAPHAGSGHYSTALLMFVDSVTPL